MIFAVVAPDVTNVPEEFVLNVNGSPVAEIKLVLLSPAVMNEGE